MTFVRARLYSESAALALRARAVQTKRVREAAATRSLSAYVFDVAGYAVRFMGYDPWAGQRTILDDISRSYEEQFERADYMAGRITAADLKVWTPGTPIRNFFRVESGHGFGKTKLVSTVVNHAFDTLPSVEGYTFATDWEALRAKLWKEIIGDRQGKGLPGVILEGALRLRRSAKHWIQARATTNAKGRGKGRLQGVHGAFYCFVVDEADEVEPYVFDAINSNTTGGIGVVVFIGNPRSRASRFYRMRTDPRVHNYRFSSLTHPNVEQGREVIPGGGVSREWVDTMIAEHCTTVGYVPAETAAEGWRAVEAYGLAFDPDEYTFAAPWHAVTLADGTSAIPVLRGDDAFLYQVQGIPPKGSTSNTLIAYGRIEGARTRGAAGTDSAAYRLLADGVTHADDLAELDGMPAGSPDDLGRVTLGVDVARFGTDRGTIYVRFRGRVWRAAEIAGQSEDAYLRAILATVSTLAAAALAPLPVPGKPVAVARPLTSVHVRVDNGGGYGTALIRALTTSAELDALAPAWLVTEVLNNAAPVGKAGDGVTDAVQLFDNLGTQLYVAAGEALADLRLGGVGFDVPDTLDVDLAERHFIFRLRRARERKALEKKSDFRDRHGRSPDDGDGLALALAPDSVLAGQRRHVLGTEAGGKRRGGRKAGGFR